MNQTRTILFVTCMIAMLDLSACSTQQVAADTNNDARPKPVNRSPGYDGVVVSIRNAQERRNIATWEKQRALYLYDLHMAALEQRFDGLSDPDYLLGEKLIQAALNVAYAQSDQLTLDDPQSALHDLADASSKLAAANNLAPPAAKPRMAEVRRLLATARASAAGHCKATANETLTYKTLRTQLDRLIQDVG